MKSSVIKQRSVVSLAIIFVLITINYFNIIHLSEGQTETGIFINKSGKQRMLSQRIILLSERYMEKLSPDTAQQLLATIDSMEQDFLYLKNNSRGIVKHIYEGRNYRLEYYMGVFLKKARTVAQKQDLSSLNYIRSLGDYILKTSDTAVSLFEQQHADYIRNVRIQSTLIAAGSLLILVLIYFFILRPSIKTNETLIKELLDSEEKISEIMDNTGALIYVKDLAGRYLLVNHTFESLFGISQDAIKGRTDQEVFSRELFSRQNDTVVYENKKITVEESVIIGEARYIFLIDKFPVKTGNHVTYGLCGVATDITPMKTLQREINEYVKIVDENVITSKTDLKGTITYVSEAFCTISGFSKEELLGKQHKIVRHPDMPKSIFKAMWETITDGGTWQGEIKNLTKSGGYYWVDTIISPSFDLNGNIEGYTAIRHDITDKKRIEEMSVTDELTRLYNRRHFNQVITEEIHRCRRDERPFTFILLDVDNFKKYNDTYGHQMGDHVLSSIGSLLREHTHRAGDYAFRLGGEEFGLIINSDSADNSRQFAETIRNGIESLGIEHENNPPLKTVTASIGVCIVADAWEGNDEQSIYKDADEMLYRAKENGRNRVEYKEM